MYIGTVIELGGREGEERERGRGRERGGQVDPGGTRGTGQFHRSLHRRQTQSLCMVLKA